VKCDYDSIVLCLRRLGLLSILVALLASVASAAAANPLGDCFERIAVAVRHVQHPHAAPRPHAVHKVHHVHPGARRPHRVKVVVPTAAYAHQTHYILRPRACGTNELMMTPLPGAVGPEAPELLLSALAGPLPPPGVDVSDEAPLLISPSSPTPDLPALPPTGAPPTGGFVLPPGGSPGGPGGIPEPATWAMLIVGFFGIGAALRQRRSRSALACEI
jgi:hypothetical protein